MLEVLDSLRRLLDSPQRILSHVRLDSTHGTSRTAMPADERKRRCAAAEKARRVRLRQAVSAAETSAAQNEPLTDEQQRLPRQRRTRHHIIIIISIMLRNSNSSSSGNRNGCLRLTGSGDFSGWTGRRLLRDAAASKRNGDGVFC